MKPDVPTRRALAVAAVLVAAAIALPRFLTHTPYQRLGAAVVKGVVERVVGPPSEGVLRPGDRLVSVNGMLFENVSVRDSLRARGWPRGPIQLAVERAGRTLVFTLPPVRLSAWERLRIYTYPIAAVIAAPIVAFLLVWRRPDLPTAWMFLWFAALQGLSVIWGLYQFPQGDFSPGFRLYLRVYHVLSWLYPASFVHFMAVFPRARWHKGRRLANAWVWLTIAAYVTPIVLWATSGDWTNGPGELTYDWYQAVALSIGILSLVERYSRTTPDFRAGAHQRALAMLAAFAMLASAALNVIAADPRFMNVLPVATQRVLFTGILVAWLSTPFIFAYLIAEDPLFDPRRLIVGGLPFALLSGVLAAIYLGVVLVGQRLFASATGERTLVFNVVAALVLAFAFAPLRERVQRAIARIYGRDPEALRAALDQAGRDLLSALDPAEVRAGVEAGLLRGLRRSPAITWSETAAPTVVEHESVPDFARADVETLLRQAGIRLENLRLAAGRAAAERSAVELQEAATRAELRALQAQVQPHFLFNALNAQAYLIETDPAAAQRFTGRLADMLRYTVEAGKHPAALLADEIAFVEDYLGVARERYENPLEFRYLGDPELLSMAVPPLLLQPLVENSLKHGIAPGGNAMTLTLDARRSGDWFELEFADDGNPNGNGSPGLGVGLENLEQRVRRFAGAESHMTAGPRNGSSGTPGFLVRMRWLAAEGEGR